MTQLLANPNQELIFHLESVAEVSKKIIQRLSLSNVDEKQKKIIENLAYYCGLLHDIGKVDPVFQRYINDKTTTNYTPNGVHVEKIDKKNKFNFEEHPRHNEISWFIIEELTTEKDFKLNKKYFNVLKSVILWHHAAPIRNFQFDSSNIISAIKKEKEDFFYNLKTILKNLKIYEDDENINDLIHANSKEFMNYKALYSSKNKNSLENISLDDIKNDIKVESISSLLRAVVITADRYVSASKNNVNINEIIEKIFEKNKYSKLSYEIKKMEEDFYPETHRSKQQLEAATKLSKIQDIAILNAPAGAGKTKTALQWARLKKSDKIYYIAPRTVICEEIYLEFKNTYLKRNVSIELLIGEKKIKWNGRKEVEMEEDSEYYNSDIIITTIDQLIKSVTTHKNISTLFDMLNSCVIFDEFHEYYKLSGFDVLFAEYIKLKSFLKNSQTLLMSATPNYFMLEHYLDIYNPKSSLKNLISFETVNKKDFSLQYYMYNEDDALPKDTSLFSRRNGKDFYLDFNEDVLDFTQKSPFLKKWNDKKTIVISNTATMAQISYLINNKNENAYLAHSKYTKEDKKNILKEIKDSFKNLNNKKYDILRAGPIVQASLNITSERLITDISNPENILQRLGRLNRFGEDFIGDFIIGIPNRALNKNGKEPSQVLRLLSRNYEKDSTIYWLEFLKSNFNIENKVNFKLKDIYDLYYKFYQEEKTKIIMEEELLESLKKSYLNIKNNILDPVEIIGKKIEKTKIKKLSKQSLRGEGYLTKMAVYNLEKNCLQLTNNQVNNVNLSKDTILLYSDNYLFVDYTIDKYHILNKNEKNNKIENFIKKAKKNKDKYKKYVLDKAREEDFNIITSLSFKDLELVNKENNKEESIVYLKTNNNVIGYLSLKKLIN